MRWIYLGVIILFAAATIIFALQNFEIITMSVGFAYRSRFWSLSSCAATAASSRCCADPTKVQDAGGGRAITTLSVHYRPSRVGCGRARDRSQPFPRRSGLLVVSKLEADYFSIRNRTVLLVRKFFDDLKIPY